MSHCNNERTTWLQPHVTIATPSLARGHTLLFYWHKTWYVSRSQPSGQCTTLPTVNLIARHDHSQFPSQHPPAIHYIKNAHKFEQLWRRLQNPPAKSDASPAHSQLFRLSTRLAYPTLSQAYGEVIPMIRHLLEHATMIGKWDWPPRHALKQNTIRWSMSLHLSIMTPLIQILQATFTRIPHTTYEELQIFPWQKSGTAW